MVPSLETLMAGKMLACLERNRRRYQLAPRFSVADLLSPERSRGLAPEDFFVARALQGSAPLAGMIVFRFGRSAEYFVGWYGPEARQAFRWILPGAVTSTAPVVRFALAHHSLRGQDRAPGDRGSSVPL